LVNKGKKICKFYPDIQKKSILIFSVIFLICPIPVIFLGFILDIIKNLHNAISYIIVMDIVFILSSPFIMFIIYYLQSITIYSKGIHSFNPINNRSDFMSWSSMEDIKYNPNIRNGYYIINSFDNDDQLWLPAYLKNKKNFIGVVSEYAGENHALTRALSKGAIGDAV
jgi:hypothetical protein